MENLIYWNGMIVGIDCGRFIAFFTSAPPEAVVALQSR